MKTETTEKTVGLATFRNQSDVTSKKQAIQLCLNNSFEKASAPQLSVRGEKPIPQKF